MDAYDLLNRRKNALERRWTECDYDARGYALAGELMAVAELWTHAVRAKAELLSTQSERRARTFAARADQQLAAAANLAHDLQNFADACRESLSVDAELQARGQAASELGTWLNRHRRTIEADIGTVGIGVPMEPRTDGAKEG